MGLEGNLPPSWSLSSMDGDDDVESDTDDKSDTGDKSDTDDKPVVIENGSGMFSPSQFTLISNHPCAIVEPSVAHDGDVPVAPRQTGKGVSRVLARGIKRFLRF
jgi:hypothetical protein